MGTKLQTDWTTQRDELNRRLRAYQGGASSLKKAAKINYFAARRFLKNGVSNRTEAAIALCGLFGIDKAQEPQSEELQKLVHLVEQVWDGTPAHASLLAKLIRSTKPFAVEERIP